MDYVDQPTFVILPVMLRTGRITVDILSRLKSGAPEFARAFAGLAYHISDDCRAFESVYLRPLNGLKCAPPPPRHKRAIQHFAYPDWPFDRLRERFPDNPHEASADIGPDEWIRLDLSIGEKSVTAQVNGTTVLSVTDTLVPAISGRVGLWVDIGTEAFFSNLTVSPD